MGLDDTCRKLVLGELNHLDYMGAEALKLERIRDLERRQGEIVKELEAWRTWTE